MGKLLRRAPVLLFLFGSFLLGSYHHNSNGGPFLGVDAHSDQHGHSHDEEDHNAEPVAYKYSREANQAVEHHGHDHDHGSHAHDHTHGHIHDEAIPRTNHEEDDDDETSFMKDLYEEHAHSHGGKYAPDADDHQHHGHTHGPGGCSHTHSHDAHTHAQHGHSSSDPKPSLKQRILKTKDEDVYNPNGYLWFMNDAYTRLWVLSIGSTVLISIAPFLILAVIPVQANTAENEPLLKVLLSFGSGGLLGDAFLHLIPHSQPAANGAHAHSHSHGAAGGHAHGPHDMSVGAYVLAGIIAFLTVEKLVRIFRGEDGEAHGHSHGLVVQKEGHKGKKQSNKADKAKKSDASSAEESCDDDDDDDDDGEGENCKLIAHKPKQPGFKVAAYLNMAADFTHNFTDGLAIGASYLAGTTIGLVTMLTVLVHEVPHEIGDFAILVQSGFSKKRAMCVQLLTAVGAISGCVLSLLTADAHNLAEAAAASWVLPFTAGGFIYIATVSVIPELLVNSSPWQSIKEIIALLTGIALMYLIAIFE